MEIENAVNAAKKELANRFDFKGSQAGIVLEKNEIKLSAEDQFKMRALLESSSASSPSASISLKTWTRANRTSRRSAHARQIIKIKQGLDSAVAKQVAQFVRDNQIEGDHANPRRRGPSKRPEQGRFAGRHRRRAWTRFPGGAAVSDFRISTDFLADDLMEAVTGPLKKPAVEPFGQPPK